MLQVSYAIEARSHHTFCRYIGVWLKGCCHLRVNVKVLCVALWRYCWVYVYCFCCRKSLANACKYGARTIVCAAYLHAFAQGFKIWCCIAWNVKLGSAQESSHGMVRAKRECGRPIMFRVPTLRWSPTHLTSLGRWGGSLFTSQKGSSWSTSTVI